MSANPYGTLSSAPNASGGTDIFAGPTKWLTVNADGTISFATAQTNTQTETITGALTVAGLLTANGGLTGINKITVQSISGDGAISVPTVAQGIAVVTLSKGSAAAITLIDAVAADIGKIIIVKNTTAFAHVITAATGGFNAKGSSGTATSATPFVGTSLVLMAVAAGHWMVVNGYLWTIA